MKTQSRKISVIAVICGLTVQVAAQKHPAPGDPRRNIEVFDVQDIVRVTKADEKGVKEAGVPILKDVPILGRLFQRTETTQGFSADKLKLEALARFVRGFIRPSLIEGDEIKSLGDKSLLALASPEKLAWITRFLVENRKQGKYQVVIDARFLSVPPNAFRAFVKPRLDASKRTLKPKKPTAQSATGRTGPLVNTKGVTPEKINKYALLATIADRNEFLAKLEKQAGVSLLHAPKILTFPMIRSDLLIGKKIPYVKDFNVEVAKKQVIANPIIDTIMHGIHLGCTVAVIPKGQIGIDVEFTSSNVKQPIPEFTTTLGVGTPITVQLPEMTMVRLHSRTELTNDQSALFALETPEGNYLVTLLRATISK